MNNEELHNHFQNLRREVKGLKERIDLIDEKIEKISRHQNKGIEE